MISPSIPTASALLLVAWLSIPLGVSRSASLATETPVAVPSHQHRAARPVEKIRYSEFNHQVSGMMVLAIGLLAMSMEIGLARRPDLHAMQWLWPAGWLLLGAFLFIRNDPDNWPWGPIGLMDTLLDPETLQHQVFTLVVMAIGVIEGLRTGRRLNGRGWGLLFPLLGIGSGVVLGLHAQVHVLSPHVYLQHTALALVAILVGVSKLLRERGKMPGFYGSLLWPALLMLLGMQLLFYTEH